MKRVSIMNRPENLLHFANHYYDNPSRLGEVMSFFNAYCNRFYLHAGSGKTVDVHMCVQKPNLLTFSIRSENLYDKDILKTLKMYGTDFYRILSETLLTGDVSSPSITVEKVDGKTVVTLSCCNDYDSEADSLFHDRFTAMQEEFDMCYASIKKCKDLISEKWYISDDLKRLFITFSTFVLSDFMYQYKYVPVTLFDYGVQFGQKFYMFGDGVDQ